MCCVFVTGGEMDWQVFGYGMPLTIVRWVGSWVISNFTTLWVMVLSFYVELW